MKFQLSIILVLFCNVLFGQSFNLNDLIYLSKSDYNTFDTYVTGKNFQYLEKLSGKAPITNVDYNGDVYVQLINGRKTNFVAKIDYQSNDESKAILRTIDSQVYLRIKKELINNNYKVIENGTDENGNIYFKYKKGSIVINMISDVSTNSTKQNRIDYEINISYLK